MIHAQPFYAPPVRRARSLALVRAAGPRWRCSRRCGGGPSDEEQVHATLTAFGRATAAKDYQRALRQAARPEAGRRPSSVGLPCEVALKQGLGDVRQPRLTIGAVTVTARRRSPRSARSAEGQAPSKDTLELERTGGGWRIASLATPSEPGPAP